MVYPRARSSSAASSSPRLPSSPRPSTGGDTTRRAEASQHTRRSRAEGCGAAGPDSGEDGKKQHGNVFDKEHGIDGALHPGEATAIGAGELVIEDADVDHEGDEKDRGEPGAPAAEAGKEDEDPGKGFGDSERKSKRQGDVFGHEQLVQAHGPPSHASDFPDTGGDKKSGDQNGRDPVGGGLPCRPVKLRRTIGHIVHLTNVLSVDRHTPGLPGLEGLRCEGKIGVMRPFRGAIFRTVRGYIRLFGRLPRRNRGIDAGLRPRLAGPNKRTHFPADRMAARSF